MMSRFILLALATLAMLCESQICLAASDMGEVGLLQNIFKCYSASNWYGGNHKGQSLRGRRVRAYRYSKTFRIDTVMNL